MREMKDSGIPRLGKIPKSWRVPRIKHLYLIIGSGTTPPSGQSIYYDDGEYFWIQSGDLYKTKYITDTEKKLTRNAIDSFPTLKKFPADFLVVAMYGASIGNVSISKVNAVTNQACCAIVPQKCVDFNYLYYVLIADKDIMLDMSIGGTQPNISQAKILELPVPFPTFSEQKAISDFLETKCSEIDSLIADIQKQIEILEEYKRSVITEAVTKGFDKNAEINDSGIEWIEKMPSTWSKTKIGYSSYLRARLGWKGLKADEYVEIGYPFLSAFNIIDDMLSWDKLNYISKERYEESPEIMLKIHDILLVKDGAGIGKCAKIDDLPYGESTTNGSLAVISTFDRLDYKYLYYYFVSSIFQNYIQRIMNGMGVPHLSQEELRKITIPLPPLEEQKAISKKLDIICSEIYSTIIDKKKQLETLEKYKKSIIFEYVTGKKEVY